jgi:dipeptidyl aminopeptidase/acylaminoacyl peptidase
MQKIKVYEMRYLGDELEVVGFLLKPKANDVEYPVMIFNRGGNREFSKIEAVTLAYLSGWTALSYVVVSSQYRGNDGGQGTQEFGGSDVIDMLNLIPLVDSLPFVSPDKIAMAGFSKGGIITYIALTMTDRVKIAAIFGGVTDLFQLYSEREQTMKKVMIDLTGRHSEGKGGKIQKALCLLCRKR